MKNPDELIKEFKTLKLEEYPVDKIKELILEIGEIGVIKNTLHEGKVVYRARPNKEDKIFTKVSELSFLPAVKNSTYKRASTPNNTMFYGTILPEIVNAGELNENRIVGLFECIPFLRNSDLNGEQKITFGKWVVTKDIHLIAIVQHSDFRNKSEYIKEMNEGFEEFIAKYPDKQERTLIILGYLASEFAKKETDHDYDYLISALFTERMIEKSLAGVLYPSVRTGGDGFNVAIHPDSVKSCMILTAVGECTVYKKGKKTIVDNETLAYLKEGEDIFKLERVHSNYYIGREKALQEINK